MDDTQQQDQQQIQDQDVQDQRQDQQDQQSAPPGKTYDEDYVKSLRSESARYRTQLRDAQNSLKDATARLEAFGDVTTEELERLRGRDTQLTEFEAKAEVEKVRSAFKEQIDLPQPKMALGAALEAGIEIKLDKDGKVEGLEDIRKRLREENPAIFGDGSIDGGKRIPEGNGYDGPGGVGRLRHAYESQKS